MIDALIKTEQSIHQLIFAEQSARTGSENLQNSNFASFQLNLAIAYAHVAALSIELQIAASNDVGRFTAVAPQQNAHARFQFTKIKGLDQIVVCAKVESAYTILDLRARC
ncbi:hypothetical protein D3C80_1771720 [compost metagenome]